MILVAPDKFKGTLTAREAARIIAEALAPLPTIMAPMADGGEGTSAALCRGTLWQKHDLYYVNQHTRTAVIDSSAVIGLQCVDPSHHDILKASSAPLGIKVREIIKGGCQRVVIGIGGTATCDGGMGFLEGLGVEKLSEYRDRIVGLSDVRVPLIADGGQPSALMFAPQKGASDLDMQILRNRLQSIYDRYPERRSPFDGAGGGLGFAIASVIGAPCYDGARFVIDSYDINWQDVDMIVTGEGSIDRQTDQGKVVGTLRDIASEHNIPLVAIGGRVDADLESDTVVSSARYYTDLPLDSKTAALRLKAAAQHVSSLIVRLMD